MALIPLHLGQLVLFTANQGASNLSERAISQVEGSEDEDEDEEEEEEEEEEEGANETNKQKKNQQ